MRKCRYKLYEIKPGPGSYGYEWQTQPKIATFIKWGVDFQEFENGPVNFTCAIIELDDGEIKMIRADMIKFINDKT